MLNICLKCLYKQELLYSIFRLTTFFSPLHVGDLRYGTNETFRAFQKVLHLYKSGLYLQKKPSHLKGMDIITSEEDQTKCIRT